MNEQEEDPQPFEAVHVTAVVPVENDDPDAGTQVTVGDVPVAEGVLNVAIWLSHCVMSEGHEPITGGVQFSVIFTSKLHEPVPHELVAEQVTVVVPIGKLLPDGGVQVAVTDGVPPEGAA